jgi:hypothetical protein
MPHAWDKDRVYRITGAGGEEEREARHGAEPSPPYTTGFGARVARQRCGFGSPNAVYCVWEPFPLAIYRKWGPCPILRAGLSSLPRGRAYAKRLGLSPIREPLIERKGGKNRVHVIAKSASDEAIPIRGRRDGCTRNDVPGEVLSSPSVPAKR